MLTALVQLAHNSPLVAHAHRAVAALPVLQLAQVAVAVPRAVVVGEVERDEDAVRARAAQRRAVAQRAQAVPGWRARPYAANMWPGRHAIDWARMRRTAWAYAGPRLTGARSSLRHNQPGVDLS